MANDESARLSLSKIHNVPPGRVLVSLSDLCEMLGMTRNPVMEKISQGLPYLEKGSQQKPKRAWSFDSKAVVDWLCEQARQEGHEQAMRKLGGMSPPSADGEGGGYGPSLART